MKIKVDTNLYDYSDWRTGTSGSTTEFNMRSSGYRKQDTNPWGQTDYVWANSGYTTGTTNGGGWNNVTHPGGIQSYLKEIDPTKTYRCSVWMKRDVISTHGSFYFGAFAFNSSFTIINMYSNTTNVASTNLYFAGVYYNNLNIYAPVDEWRLFVGHIHPYNGTTGITLSDTGIYKPDGTKLVSISDLRFDSSTQYMTMRCLCPYDSDIDAVMYNAYPRMDVVDGTEPAISTLLNNEGFWRDVSAMKINIGDTWKTVKSAKINIGDTWKTFLESSFTATVLVVGGGGGGGSSWYNNRGGGGGGGGGLIYNSAYTLTDGSSYTVTIGNGGAGTQSATVSAQNGGDTIFGALTAKGGGRGGMIGSNGNAYNTPSAQGSGGGGCSQNQTGANPTAGQGYKGGNGLEGSGMYGGAGGGGAGGAGTNTTTNIVGAGGVGANYSSVFGTSVGESGYFAGGGGASGTDDLAAEYSAGGNGGGGNGAATGVSGSANTGGGGGAGHNKSKGGNGGSGVVIVKYLGTPRGTGGTITQAGGYTTHVFTTSGNLIIS